MSKVDTAWLRMEQPTNLMMINGVIVMGGPVDYERLLEVIERRLLAFRRFRQKAEDGAGGAAWVEDEDFDLRWHVRRIALPGKADRRELEILVSDLASSPLDPARPLWQFHLVENYEEGPVVVSRIHHCIADGIALVQVFLSLTDTTPDAHWSDESEPGPAATSAGDAPVFDRLLAPAREGLDFITHVAQRALGEGQRIAGEPGLVGDYAVQAAEIFRELAHSLTLPEDPDTRLRGRLGVRKQVAWAEPIPLDEVKSVGKAFGCTVNDVLISAVTGALRKYLVSVGDDPAELEDIRATVPVNLRPLEHAKDLGNHFGLVFLSLPLAEANPVRRLFLVNDRMTELKASKQAAVTFGFLAALGMGPAALQKPVLDILSAKATTVLTNVPGPQHPIYLAGTCIREMMFWVPQNGGIGLGISILSYDGQVFFGLIADRRLVPRPREVIEGFRPEFEKLLYLAMMMPAVDEHAPDYAERLTSAE